MFDKFLTKDQLFQNLSDLIGKAISESDPKDPTMNPAWRQSVKKAWDVANVLELDFISDLLWEVYKLHGNGVSLRMNAQAFLRVVKREINELKNEARQIGR